MLVECILGKMRVAFQYVNHYRAPRNNVALLGFFIELREGANDIGAQAAAVSIDTSQSKGWG